ncbi:MAG: SDR family oxidoreductase [Promethearchaeota archaeon]
MNTLKDKTLFITGASRGIGKAIALRAAKDGANIAVVAKTKEPHPKLPGTVYSAVEDVKSAGGNAIPCITDIRFEKQVQAAVDATIKEFGKIDILINNASAINLSPTLDITMKRYDLMFHVNVRGTFLCSKLCIPYLKKTENPHILNLSPPINLDPKWFKNNLAYTMAKYGMSMCVLGMAEEYKNDGIAVNALWPRTPIATAAVKNLLGGESAIKHSRKPEIVADAAYIILNKPSNECTGNFFIDEDILIEHGIINLEKYSVDPTKELYQDFFL